MQCLNNLIHPELISGGTTYILYPPYGTEANPEVIFDRPVIGYTQTLVEWTLINKFNMGHNATQHTYYEAVYAITPIYAPQENG